MIGFKRVICFGVNTLGPCKKTSVFALGLCKNIIAFQNFFGDKLFFGVYLIIVAVIIARHMFFNLNKISDEYFIFRNCFL